MRDPSFQMHHKHEHVKSFEKNFDLIKDTNQFLIFFCTHINYFHTVSYIFCYLVGRLATLSRLRKLTRQARLYLEIPLLILNEDHAR